MSLRAWSVLFALAAAAALAIAHGSEKYGGLVPCALCLVERWPYRVAFALAVAAAFLPLGLARAALGLVALTAAAGAAVAAIHVGVEWHWWPSPLPECAAPSFGGGSIAERLARMPAVPAKPCDEPTYLIPDLPISIAQLNLLYSLAFAAAAAFAASRRPSR
jgi:disulfide bond formation protein DsbB